MPANSYAKLPGTGVRLETWYWVCFLFPIAVLAMPRCRLWLGLDHLLAMEYAGAAESYRRFYFRDIEAFVIRRTHARRDMNVGLLILGLLTAGPLFLYWIKNGDGGLLVAALVVATFWGAFAFINSIRGPACQTHIRTAVQFEPLPSLGRVRTANKVLARLQPLIAAAQGVPTGEDLTAAAWGADVPVTPGPALKRKRPDKGTLHGAVFCILIAEAILAGIFYAIYKEPLSTLGMFAMFAGFVLCIMALARQGSSDLPAGLRAAAKWAFASYLLKAGVGFVYAIVFSVNHPYQPMETGLEMIGEAGFDVAALVCIGIGAAVGLFGLGRTLAHVRSRAAAPVS